MNAYRNEYNLRSKNKVKKIKKEKKTKHTLKSRCIRNWYHIIEKKVNLEKDYNIFIV